MVKRLRRQLQQSSVGTIVLVVYLFRPSPPLVLPFMNERYGSTLGQTRRDCYRRGTAPMY